MLYSSDWTPTVSELPPFAGVIVTLLHREEYICTAIYTTSRLDLDGRVDVVHRPDRPDRDVDADDALGEVQLRAVDVHEERRLLAVGARHQRPLGLHAGQELGDLALERR